jgi:alpha-NAC-related protein
MFGGINAKQVEKVMKKMGISQIPLDAKRVTIELEDSNIVIDEPSVMKVTMQGQETFQISGEARHEEKGRELFNNEDVRVVMEKTGASEEKVREVLEQNKGDIAGAIMELGKA